MMMNDIITSLSIIMSVVGLFISLVLISNINASKWQKNVNKLITNYKFEDILPKEHSKAYLFMKRLFDIIFSCISIFSLFPLFLICIALIKLELNGPVFIKAQRIGKDGKQFSLYRFRTKTSEIQIENVTQSFSKIGLFLDKTYLDSLPIIINIIKGEMSFIGVSPYIEGHYMELPESIRTQIGKHKPGMVSLWGVSWDKEKFKLESKPYFDLYYINKASLLLDLLILFRCMGLVFAKTGTF